MKLPAVLVQVAFAEQLSVPSAHSSVSLQVTPLPLNPARHAQVKLPGVFAQVAFTSQLSVPSRHSSSSVQLTPSPE